MPIGSATLEKLRLRLQAKQLEVRRAVQAEQEEIMQVRLGWRWGGVGWAGLGGGRLLE